MRCPYCHAAEQDRVLDSRPVEGGDAIRRRRVCSQCQRRYTTYERIEQVVRLTVVKKDGSRVPFDRNRILEGIHRACYKRPIPAETIARLVDAVEEQVARQDQHEVSSAVIGEQVMKYLRQIDPIAYVRFASVYHQFKDLGELVQEAREVMEKSRHVDPDQPDLFTE